MGKIVTFLAAVSLVMSISLFSAVPTNAADNVYSVVQTPFTVAPNHTGVLVERGSTIQHLSSGVTEVIRPNGSIQMSALDSQSDLVMTPYGLEKADDVYFIPNGAHVVPSANGHTTKVLDENQQLILTIIYDKTIPRAPSNGNILYTTYTTNVGEFMGYLTVPAPPRNISDTTFYWLGVQKSPYISQSVLQWNQAGYSQEWSIASWENSGAGYFCGPTHVVNQGDSIECQQVYELNGEWSCVTYDQNNGAISIIWESNMGETNDIIVTSLENYNSQGNPATGPNDMPGSENCYSLCLYLPNGGQHSISWHINNPFKIPTSTAQVTYDTSSGSWVNYNTHH